MTNRERAYARLGVSPNDVLLAPKITPLLRRICAEAEPGHPRPQDIPLTAVITYLRASSAVPARKFISVYDDPSLEAGYRRELPIEAFCLAAKIDPTDLLAPIAQVAHLQGAMLGAIRAAEKHPEIVDASIASALTPEGIEDRMANLKHMGYLPSPKGSSINVNVNANATAAAAATAASATLPAPEDTIRRMVEQRQRVAALAAPATRSELPPPSAAIPAFMPRSRESQTIDAEYAESED